MVMLTVLQKPFQKDIASLSELIKNETGGVADMYGKCSDELHHSFVVVRQ